MDADEYSLMDEVEDTMWWYRALHARLLRHLQGTSGRILDAGCGTGGFLRILRKRRPDLAVVGVDFFPAAAARAAVKSGAPAVCASVTSLPFANRSFDAIVSADVLCHASLKPDVALAEFKRVLRPDGLLVLNMPALAWLTSAHDRRVHTARRLDRRQMHAALTAAGFRAVETRYWNFMLLPLMVLKRKLLTRRPDDESDVKTFHPALDAMFFAATEADRLMPMSPPLGASVMAVGRA